MRYPAYFGNTILSRHGKRNSLEWKVEGSVICCKCPEYFPLNRRDKDLVINRFQVER